jgi:DNA polymerase-3 subunit beta
MEMIIERCVLFEKLKPIVNVVSRHQHPIPILSNVLLSFQDQGLQLLGNDSEIELMTRLKIEHGQDAGDRLAIHGKKLYDICRVLPEGSLIKFQQQGDEMKITSGKSRFRLKLLSPQDFPTIEHDRTPMFHFSIPVRQCLALLNKTSFAIAQKDVRYFLNGLLFHFVPGCLTAVATDSHRLALSSVELPELKGEARIIVPRKSIIELERLLTEDDDSLMDVVITESCAKFSTERFDFTTKLIDSEFPQYQGFIPKKLEQSINLDKEAFKAALSRVSILLTDKFKGALFNFSTNNLSIQVTDANRDHVHEEMSIDYQGPEIKLGCNVVYLLDILNVMEGDLLTIMFSDASTSMLVEPSQGVEKYVVMPLCL